MDDALPGQGLAAFDPLHIPFTLFDEFSSPIQRIVFVPTQELNSLEVIPVIDLLNGEVVHAVAGNRELYQPFTTSRFKFASPRDFAEQLQEEFASAPIYLADLDAIQGLDPQLDLIGEMLASGGEFLIDFGLKNPVELSTIQQRLAPMNNWSAILASETVSDVFSFLQQPDFDPRHFYFSLDIRAGQVLAAKPIPDDGGVLESEFADVHQPLEWIEKLMTLGFRNLIVMDLDAVGTGHRVQLDHVENSTASSNVKLYAAGGVQSAEDLTDLKNRGFAGALVATAIHAGRITGKTLVVQE